MKDYYPSMAYTKNPHMPKVRREAAAMVHRGHTPSEAGRRFGVSASTVCKWVKKARLYGHRSIPTLSSRPKRHPKEVPEETVRKIVRKRLERNRCAEVVHAELARDGVAVSLSSVKRTLDRRGLLKKRSPWKRFHPHQERPAPARPGSLVQMDTVHLMLDKKKRLYVYTLIDVHSRTAYAKAYAKMGGAVTLRFLRDAERGSVFHFETLQSDHGPEFGSWFVAQAMRKHRYTRIGKPNDNAHIERFNRTLQEECLDGVPRTPSALNKALRKYLHYYNNERLHLGIQLRTPAQLLEECVQAID